MKGGLGGVKGRSGGLGEVGGGWWTNGGHSICYPLTLPSNPRFEEVGCGGWISTPSIFKEVAIVQFSQISIP